MKILPDGFQRKGHEVYGSGSAGEEACPHLLQQEDGLVDLVARYERRCPKDPRGMCDTVRLPEKDLALGKVLDSIRGLAFLGTFDKMPG